jgi:hypothetical protein
MKVSDLISETASAGSTSSGSIAANPTGFASGGIGTVSRAGSKKRKSMAETHKPGHMDHEVSMAHSDAQNLAKNAATLDQLLRSTSEQEGLPGWVSGYITLANDYIENVTQYLLHHQDQQFSGAEHE